MSGYARLVGGLLAVLLAVYALVEALDVAWLSDPAQALDEAGVAAALTGVGLLVIDVAVPIPTSIVMVAHGVLFGVVGGALLSLAGAVGATLLGFAIGRRGRGLVERLVEPAARGRVERLVARHGVVALVVTRPVPLLAETVAILAGTSALPWRYVAVAAVAGNVAPAFLYAAAGAVAATALGAVAMFGLVLLISLVLWRVGLRWSDTRADA